MVEKILTATRLRRSWKSLSRNSDDDTLFRKIYWEYLRQCVLCGKESFILTFNGKYISDFSERLEDWVKYILGIRSKPLHLKVTNAPNEVIMNAYLMKNGFIVKNEELQSVKTIYEISKA